MANSKLSQGWHLNKTAKEGVLCHSRQSRVLYYEIQESPKSQPLSESEKNPIFAGMNRFISAFSMVQRFFSCIVTSVLGCDSIVHRLDQPNTRKEVVLMNTSRLPLKPRFKLGELVISTEARRRLTVDGEIHPALQLHASAHWGEQSRFRWQANDWALHLGQAVKSIFYSLDGIPFVVVTSGDRKSTFVCLRDEQQ
jgi:hypothetical protein